MTSATPTYASAGTPAEHEPSAFAEIRQETLALTRRLFLQLQRRPSTLVAGVLQQQGIGRLLLQEVADTTGPHVQQVLLSAPSAMGYYPKVGFSAIDNAFAVQRAQ